MALSISGAYTPLARFTLPSFMQSSKPSLISMDNPTDGTLSAPTIKKWSPPPLTCREQVVLTRLIGHTFLTHSHLLLGNPPETCRRCEVPLTWNHIFLECPLYMVARVLFNLPDSIKDCLLSSINIRTTLNFLKAIKLFRKL
nr:unnamed protein product [Callosobruchus analis]